MVKGKGAALLALGLAGAAYWFKNRQQVKQTVNAVVGRTQNRFQDQSQAQQLQRGERSGDWSQGNIA